MPCQHWIEQQQESLQVYLCVITLYRRTVLIYLSALKTLDPNSHPSQIQNGSRLPRAHDIPEKEFVQRIQVEC